MTNPMVDTVIVNGRVVSGNGTRETGIAVKDGIIVALAEPEALPPAKRTIDAHGQHVLPGIVDPECHVGSHRPLKDSLDSETRAAAAGGVTTWGIMQSSSKLRKEYNDEPRPEDVVPYSEVMSEFIGVLESNAFIDCFLTGFITTDAQALDIPRVAREFGVTSFKYYLHTMQGANTYSVWPGRERGGHLGFDDGTVYLGMEKTAELGPPGVVCIHPENYQIVRLFEERLKRAGRTDMAAWDERSPHFCEAGHVRTYAYYAGVTGCPLYVVHTTTRETLDEINKARAEGVEVYSQTGHHYLSLSHDVWKINVPLRDEETMGILWDSLRDGEIDCIGSDHVDWGMSRAEMDKGKRVGNEQRISLSRGSLAAGSVDGGGAQGSHHPRETRGGLLRKSRPRVRNLSQEGRHQRGFGCGFRFRGPRPDPAGHTGDDPQLRGMVHMGRQGAQGLADDDDPSWQRDHGMARGRAAGQDRGRAARTVYPPEAGPAVVSRVKDRWEGEGTRRWKSGIWKD